tara:strand:+ start:6156 stop:6449 length:294 start_codon:yes stop_codon:yes gene_type:complete
MEKTTNLFEQKFKSLFKPLTGDPKGYSKLKKTHSEDENTVGGGALGPAAAVGHNSLTNTDWYAPGDYRIPRGIGTYSRRGKVKTSKKKQRRKSKKKK